MNFGSNRRHLVFQLLPLLFLLIAIVVGTANIKFIRQLLIGALGQNANIMIDTQTVLGTLQRPWHNLAQGGESKDWRLAPIASQVRSLNPIYVRIDHIYDFYDIVSKSPSGLSFDFSKLDVVLKDIESVGAKPYIALSYTPPAIAVNGDITAPPENWGEWQLTIRKTIEHISGTLEISDVYYEVWNEPDNFGAYGLSGAHNYLTMYTYAAQGAKEAQNVRPFKFGGPAITTLKKEWIDSLISLSLNKNLPFDFFSWHTYDENIDKFRSDISQVRAWIGSHTEETNHIELDITEWGHNPANDPGYDDIFGAVHTIAVSTELSGNIDKAFVFEIQDGKDPAGKVRWGRWGLIDSSGQAKLRYEALRFLDKLGPQQLQLIGRGTWVKGIAAKDGTDSEALIVNYDPSWRHSEITPVTFTGITPGNYVLTQQLLGGVSSTQQIATTEAALKVNIPMSVNSAVFLRLHPL